MKMPHWPESKGYRNIEFGLSRVEGLLARLGNPEKRLPPVVHIAGTNGKGSTLAFLRAILEAAGQKVHVYTSPHLVEFNERIVLAGELIGDALLYDVCEECRIAAGEDIPATFFEGTTVAALLAFSRVPADIVLLETGLGGRLDATNVIAQPALTIITSISIDHQDFLGDSLVGIAAEKAAIMKPGVTCVSAPQVPEVWAVLQDYADKVGAKLVQAQAYTGELALPGKHQSINAGVAVAAAQALRGFTLKPEHIQQGLQAARWPARLQRLTAGALVRLLPEAELWLDGGHNPAAGEVLAEQARLWGDKPLYIITAMLQDKDSAAFFAPMVPYINAVYGVAIPDEPGSRSAAEITAIAQQCGLMAQEASDVKDALAAIAAVEKAPYRVLICGSLYLAGSVLAENQE